MSIFYQYKPEQPFHLSVGAVVFNDQFEICTHHFYIERVPDHLKFLSGGLPEVYHLMRETLENDETLHEAVYRGIKEEFGVEGTIERFLGSLECTVKSPTMNLEKTTLYHAVRVMELGQRTGTDEESNTDLEWYQPHELLKLYQEQAAKTDREELDETKVVERFIAMYKL